MFYFDSRCKTKMISQLKRFGQNYIKTKTTMIFNTKISLPTKRQNAVN